MGSSSLSRRALLAGLGATLLPLSAPAQEKESEGGIGGTGIVGILSDLDRLIVAGNRLRPSKDTMYSDAFGRISNRDLRVGDSLTVEARGSADALTARRIHVTYPLVGTIASVSRDGLRLVVNGAVVRLEVPSRFAQAGYRVAVHGLWRGKEVTASRLVPARGAIDLVSGTVERVGFKTAVGAVPVVRAGRTIDGGYAEALGRFETERGIFRVSERIETRRFTSEARFLTNLSIEGYLETVRERPGFRISGLGHSFRRNLRLDAFLDQRVLFNGQYNGLFAAERATVLPEDFTRRRALLRRLAG